MEYNPKKIEPKWQKAWEKKKLYKVKIDAKKPKWYSLFEFPYPSGAGLHVGHLRPYIGMDVISRKRRMEGYNVLFPIGWDAFGLPTENYAIKTGVSPEVATKQNTDNFRSQIEKLGTSLDWSREVDTTDPNYYKWTQWMFLKFFEKGMAYKAKTFINWCPKDKIGLANEEAAGGVCDRCGGPVEKREKEQWMISITKYADKLLDGLKDVDYIPQARIQQENWIGKSEGAEIDFQVAGSQEKIKVFTTRPDTIFGATYVVLSPEHWFIHGLINRETLERVRADQEIKDAPSDMVFPWKLENLQEVIGYVEETKNKPEEERTAEGKEKTGVELKGLRVINPATKEEIPVWVADYVLSTYGTGAIMAVPAHDERDFAFAKKYNLPIREVVRPIFIDKTPASGVKKDVEFVHRDAFAALVKHWSEDKYICLQWKKVDWRTLITGGAEQGEELVAAALREIKEETGYCDAKFVRNIGGLFDSQFYHVPKKVNRWAHMQPMYFELVSDKQVEVSSEEKEIHQVNWIPRSEVEAYLSVEPMKFVWNRFKSGSDIFTGEGVLVNSGAFNGVASNEAKKDIVKEVGGKMVSRYKLRDWVFSRQRYWGEPIPLVHCPKDGWVPVPEKELPLKLPKVDRYQPTDNGESPLANIEKWVNTKCPKCKGPAKRETDTMPNWAGSSWYFLRYTDPSNKKAFASKKALEYFMPVDWYNGGMEHTVLHLLYSRFWNMFLYDLGLVPMSEPYKKRTSHGMILAHDGKKMSKSLGNVINPDDLVKEFGADALRLYEMFIGPFNQAVAWDERGILGCERFLKRVWDLQEKVGEKSDERVVRGAHQLVKKVSEDIEAMSFNTAVSAMMVFVNGISDSSRLGKEEWEMFIRVLAPFAPHLTEELWAKIGNKKSIHLSKWPEVNEKLLVSETFDLIVQVNGKMRAKITLPRGVDEKVAQEKALATDDVKKWITGVLKKTIFVKDRLINFIV